MTHLSTLNCHLSRYPILEKIWFLVFVCSHGGIIFWQRNFLSTLLLFAVALFAPDFSHLTGGVVFPDFKRAVHRSFAPHRTVHEVCRLLLLLPAAAAPMATKWSVCPLPRSNVQSSRIRPQDKSPLRQRAGQVLKLLILHPLHLLVPVKHHEQDQKVPFW